MRSELNWTFDPSFVGVTALDHNVDPLRGERVVYVKIGQDLSILCPVLEQLTNSTTVWYKENQALASVSISVTTFHFLPVLKILATRILAYCNTSITQNTSNPNTSNSRNLK